MLVMCLEAATRGSYLGPVVGAAAPLDENDNRFDPSFPRNTVFILVKYLLTPFFSGAAGPSFAGALMIATSESLPAVSMIVSFLCEMSNWSYHNSVRQLGCWKIVQFVALRSIVVQHSLSNYLPKILLWIRCRPVCSVGQVHPTCATSIPPCSSN